MRALVSECDGGQGKKRQGKERQGKERKGKERDGTGREGKERKESVLTIPPCCIPCCAWAGGMPCGVEFCMAASAPPKMSSNPLPSPPIPFIPPFIPPLIPPGGI